MFWFDNEFSFKNEYIQFFGGMLVANESKRSLKNVGLTLLDIGVTKYIHMADLHS
jgi:hypothetical protein